MAGPYVSDTTVLASIARCLNKDPADLEEPYPSIARECASDANADLMTIMTGIGYTPAQVDAWDFGAVYTKRLALFFAFNTPPLRDREKGGSRDDIMDCRDQLRTLSAIVVNGAAVAPTAGGSEVGGISSSRITVPTALRDRVRHLFGRDC